MLMGADDGAIAIMAHPIHLACGLGLLWQGVQDLREDPSLLPAVETAGHRAPWPLALGQITPRRPGTQEPPHAIEDAPMVDSGSADLRFLGWKEWLQPLPLYVGQISSVHALQ
jgi:hypothetical protein